MLALQVVKDAVYDAFYRLTDSRSQITSYVFDVVRATVPKINLDAVFTVSICAVSPFGGLQTCSWRRAGSICNTQASEEPEVLGQCA